MVGLNFDFVVLNLMKQSCYLVYNASLFFSPVIQRQYRAKYGHGAVRTSHFSFSISPFPFHQLLLVFDYSSDVRGGDYDVALVGSALYIVSLLVI